jgi:hypothetical protein
VLWRPWSHAVRVRSTSIRCLDWSAAGCAERRVRLLLRLR